MVIKESVEPLLEEYRPPGITSLKFSKLSLGNVAPKIEGITKTSVFPIYILFPGKVMFVSAYFSGNNQLFLYINEK